MCLESFGFKKVGKWERDEELASRIRFACEDDGLWDKRVIYAFVVNGDTKNPKYIGICDKSKPPATLLCGRMKRYQYRQGEKTNKYVDGKIHECLEHGDCVSIWALKPEGDYEYSGLEIDLVRGLEYPLISKFEPEW